MTSDAERARVRKAAREAQQVLRAESVTILAAQGPNRAQRRAGRKRGERTPPSVNMMLVGNTRGESFAFPTS